MINQTVPNALQYLEDPAALPSVVVDVQSSEPSAEIKLFKKSLQEFFRQGFNSHENAVAPFTEPIVDNVIPVAHQEVGKPIEEPKLVRRKAARSEPVLDNETYWHIAARLLNFDRHTASPEQNRQIARVTNELRALNGDKEITAGACIDIPFRFSILPLDLMEKERDAKTEPGAKLANYDAANSVSGAQTGSPVQTEKQKCNQTTDFARTNRSVDTRLEATRSLDVCDSMHFRTAEDRLREEHAKLGHAIAQQLLTNPNHPQLNRTLVAALDMAPNYTTRGALIDSFNQTMTQANVGMRLHSILWPVSV